MMILISATGYIFINLNPPCRLPDFQRAPAEKLLPRQRHRRLAGKCHARSGQQHRAGGGPEPAQHRAALPGPHGRNLLHRLLPAQVQEQRLLPWKGEEH